MDCSKAILDMLRNDEDVDMQALDAFGKVPAGVMAGNFEWLGDYDGCSSLQDFHYCSVNFGINSSAIPSSAPLPSTLEFKYGVCVPEVCSEEAITRNIGLLTKLIPAEYRSIATLATPMFSDSPVNCQDFPQRPYDTGFICFTVFCLILAIMMLSGAALDVFQKYKKRKMTNDNKLRLPSHQSYGSTGETKNATNSLPEETKPLVNHEVKNIVSSTEQSNPSESLGSKPSMLQEVLLCFAFNRNISKLLDTTIGQSQSIGCLHGIRVISLTWVALGHIFAFNLMTGVENAPDLFENSLPSFFFQAVGNSYSAVDTFFFMSGLLLSYVTFTRMAKSDGKMSWLLFYFHRIWRITPLYAFVILFMIYHHPYFGDGPKWYQAIYFDSLCEKYWWRNLLYINNYFPLTDMVYIFI
ncbi:nose resistant to fluoxetine protein 6-like [Amphiura filiformis]|uniref:nose resistant to fluoxetine protein 6-like n=1 Tax=Amphiura filiformis TaxID=82378 RepID=UPI003B220EC1